MNNLPAVTTPDRLDEVFAYIKTNWQILTRSNRELARSAYDPKFTEPGTNARSIVYLPARENRAAVERDLRAQMSAQDFARLDLRGLPGDELSMHEHGLLYLPHPYVVPGGRFNEMYGWDSYFILLGLLRDGELELARGMTENFFYEIEHYGKILNANRSYYLSRSQPPFLSRMVAEIYRLTGDKNWLQRAIPFIEQTHKFWTTEPHLVTQTGLSRYWDFSDAPADEVLSDEKDAAGKTHYDRIREFYRDRTVADYDVERFYDRATDALTAAF